MRLPDVTPEPLPVPGASPDDAPFLVFRVNDEWMKYLRGAVEDHLQQRGNWNTNDETALDIIMSQVDELIYMLSEEYNPVTDYAGKIEMCAVETLPAGRLWCDGATHNRVDYPTLYSALPSAFIVDADTFTTPDMREKMPLGKGGALGINDTGGESEHTLTVSQLPSHRHDYWNGNISYNISKVFNPSTVSRLVANSTNAGAYIFEVTATDPEGDSQPHNNMPPYTVCNFVICTGE